MRSGPALTAAELVMVRKILEAHLPNQVSVYVFGSRAAGHAKALSVLDLVLEGREPLSLAVLATLAEAFDESSLPWKVDIVDRACVSKEFGRLIDNAKVTLG